MFTAYIDDSHTTQSAFVLAGYVATAENWTLFSDEWQAILDMQPALSRFKMSAAHGRWSDDQWNTRLPLMYGVSPLGSELFCLAEATDGPEGFLALARSKSSR
jgi:hypothetical protein